MKEVNFATDTYKLLEVLADKIKINLSLELGLLGGQAGQLLFLYNLAKSHPEIIENELLSEKINNFISNATTLNSDASLGYGLAGVAWFYQYVLNDQELEDTENRVVDKFYAQLLEVETWEGEFEFVLGLVGYTPYLMRRSHTFLGKKNLLSLINKFSTLAVFDENDNCYWTTSQISKFRVQKNDLGQKEINLGLAHGHVGVLAALATMCDEPFVESQARELLEAGCDWLLNNQQDADQFGSYFSYLLEHPTQSRLGWCYGDLTIALTIMRASKILNREDYFEFALGVALHCAERHPSNSDVQDAGLCHGSSGVGLIFHLLHMHSGHHALKEAALKWQIILLSSYRENGLRGLYKFNHDTETSEIDASSKVADYSLLEGYAGVGLCLLALQGGDTSWVDSLLLG